MHKNIKLLGAVAVAGVVATSGSAFTAAGSGVNNEHVSYDDATTSGVTVSNVEYKVSTTDASKLASIVFTEAEDVSVGYKATLTINGPTTTQISCTATFVAGAAGAAGVGTITCPTTANVVDVNSIALTVVAV